MSTQRSVGLWAIQTDQPGLRTQRTLGRGQILRKQNAPREAVQKLVIT
jgi:hypothetical protein